MTTTRTGEKEAGGVEFTNTPRGDTSEGFSRVTVNTNSLDKQFSSGMDDLDELEDTEVHSSCDENDKYVVSFDPPQKPASFLSYIGPVMNMLNGIFGIGIITIAITFSYSGVFLGLTIMAVYAVISSYCSYLLVLISSHTKIKSVEELLFISFDKWPTIIYDSALFLHGSMFAACYIQAVGRWLLSLTQTWIKKFPQNLSDRDEQKYLYIFITAVAFLPLPVCFLRNLKRMENVSIIKGIFCVLTLIAVIIQSFIEFDSEECRSKITKVNSNVASAVGGWAVVFVSQQWVLDVFWALPNKTPKTWRKVEHTATGVTIFLHAAVGICAFLALGGAQLRQADGNVLEAFNKSTLIDVCKLTFSLSVLLGIPIQQFTGRRSLITLIKQIVGRDQKPNWESTESVPSVPFVLCTLFTWIVSVLCALFLPLDFLASFIGVFSGSIVAFIAPSLVYLAHQSKLPTKKQMHVWLARIVLCIGIITLLGGTTWVCVSEALKKDPSEKESTTQ